MKGKFVIFEGGNGTGKTTQVKEAVNYLRERGLEVEQLDFPQYESFWGKEVSRFLAGEFGELKDISPYMSALPYLLDQATRNEDIRKWMEEGKIVISNRYCTSSMAHKTCEFKTRPEQEKFLKWFEEVAYNQLGLVKEDLTIVLHADPEISKVLAEEAKDRKQQFMERDIEEEDKDHPIASSKMYLHLAKTRPTWEMIDCMNGDTIDSIENIHKKVAAKIDKLLNIS